MAEYYDPQRSLLEDWRSYFQQRPDDQFLLPCIEGDVAMNGRRMLLNIMLTMPLIKRRQPISRDSHLLLTGIYDATVHAKVENRIVKSLEKVGYTREDLGHDIIMTMNDSHNMCYSHLGGYIRTVDIFAIADTVLQPTVRAVCTPDYGDIEDRNIERMEKAFKEQCDSAIALLSGDDLPFNIFRAPLLCNSVKKLQFSQFVHSAGPKTDTDDKMFLKPVVGSFLSGFYNVVDLAIASRAASKSTYYNKKEMANTQYRNRKIHLLNSTIHYLYHGPHGDCGDTVCMPYTPNSATVQYFIGKYFVGPDNSLVELTEDKFAMVIGKTTRFRDPITCRYTDGYCETCGGTITKSFSRHGNVGFLSNVNTGAPVAQQVLSTKHLDTTNVAPYIIPYNLRDYFLSVTNDVYLRPGIRSKSKHIALGFQRADIARLNDLKYWLGDIIRNPGQFTDIKFLYFGLVQDDGSIDTVVKREPMKGQSIPATYPHLSPEMLDVLRKHPEDIIEQDNLAWVLLRNFDSAKPIMQCAAVHSSIKQFVSDFTTLVSLNVERYESAVTFVQDVTKLIWERGKLNTHITHISCLVKACLITSKKDFHVPVVDDPDKVMFGTLGRIIPMRSIGCLLAFERINIATNKPVTYVTAKRHGLFDEFVGYNDLIERDRHWPVVTGSPVLTDHS